MKKILFVLLALGSVPVLASTPFDCTKLKHLSADDLYLATDLARQITISHLKRLGEDSAFNQDYLKLDLMDCEVVATKARIDEIIRSNTEHP